jgi:hypothetical protein
MESRGYRELSLPTTTPLPTGLLVELGLQRREEISRLKQADGPLTRQIEAVVTSWCDPIALVERIFACMGKRPRSTAAEPMTLGNMRAKRSDLPRAAGDGQGRVRRDRPVPLSNGYYLRVSEGVLRTHRTGKVAMATPRQLAAKSSNWLCRPGT